MMEIGGFVFIDESSAKTSMTRLYGWAFGGERLIDAVPHGHWSTTTMIAAVGRDGAKAPFLDSVGMDNLNCHKDSEARNLIKGAGAHAWYLPPYSPDFNPIEKMWSKIKAFLRKAAARTQQCLYQAIADSLATLSRATKKMPFGKHRPKYKN